MVVEEVMSRDPFTLRVTDTVETALKQLMEADVRHLPVVEGGRLAGIISDRDLRAIVPGGYGESSSRLSESVASVMSSDVISVSPETDMSEVIDLMIEHKVGAIPVVESNEKLVGIVSYVDALRVAREQLD